MSIYYIKNVVNTSRAEGFNDGLEQGKLEEKIATAIKMNQTGFSLQQISEFATRQN